MGRPARLEDRYEDSAGYVHVRVPFVEKFMPEHRVVMMAMLGRPLVKGESVHHKNGQRNDNRPENLELWIGPIRRGSRAGDLECPHCGEPWLATPPTEVRVPLGELGQKIRSGEWQVSGGVYEPSAGIPKPFEKLVVTVIEERARARVRHREIEGQLRFFELPSGDEQEVAA